MTVPVAPDNNASAPEPADARGMSPAKLALQALGGVIGLSLLVWCVSVAFKPENRAKLERLADAPRDQLALLVALSLIVVLVSGETFRRVLWPIRRLPFVRTHATNAIASLLALLPFKLSIVFRVIVHNRRDSVPLLTIGAWFIAVSGVILTVLAPVMLASWWRGRADAVWLFTATGGVVLSAAALLIVARFTSSDRGWSFVEHLWNTLPIPGLIRRTNLIHRAHEGLRMLSHPGSLTVCVGLRVLDLASQAARVYIAARIVGHDLPWDQAALAGSLYFLVGAVAPTGQLGAREGLTAGLAAALLKGQNLDQFAVIVLVVSASEMLVLLVLSVLGMPIVRPDRLLLRASPQPSA
jgi:Lysylphosphatidylglycerol synthase TM region